MDNACGDMAAWSLPRYLSNTELDPSFDRDMRDVHLIYDYDAQEADGTPCKWRYEIWFLSSTRVVYAIHGGPMAGRRNYQAATYQCIRPGQLWQINWLEETGTVCSLVYDLALQRITTMAAFSKGHWQRASEALGDKRNAADLERWRRLAAEGTQTERLVLSEQAVIVDAFRGRGDLLPITEEDPTM